MPLLPPELEVHRRRWRHARRGLRLVEPTDEAFALGDLGGRVVGLRVRLVVFPGDPDSTELRFDDAFWAWWQANPPPHRGAAVPWGFEHRASPWGALWCVANRETAWDAYLGLRRSGALDVGIGRPAVFQRGDLEAFRLIAILGRLWLALSAYQAMLEHFVIEGPFEASVALCNTHGAFLGNVATGWRDDDLLLSPTQLAETGYLGRWEVEHLADGDTVRELVYDVGDWLVNCWGAAQRRFISQGSQEPGDFGWDRFT